MSDALLRSLISRLSVHAFERLIVELFSESGSEEFEPVPDAGEHVFFQPLIDSYGGSLHTVFITHYSPLDLIRPFRSELLRDPVLIERIARVWELYRGQTGHWGLVSPHLKLARKLQSVAFLTNLAGFDRDAYERQIIPEYSQIAKRLRLPRGLVLVGSYDSFLDLSLEKTRRAFSSFVANNADELRITLDGGTPVVERIATERHFSAGVLAGSGTPCQPVYKIVRTDDAALLEFEELLRRGARESELERFLKAHHRLIFGERFDRIETQLWLRFPEFDIAGRQRRLDVFLRNSISGDWELRELKRANLQVATMSGSIPILAKVAANAVHQLQAYARLLSQDHVKRQLAADGIDYYEPSLGLVIGRTPDLPHAQWRWLVANTKEVNVATYDDLLNEARVRASERAQVIG